MSSFVCFGDHDVEVDGEVPVVVQEKHEYKSAGLRGGEAGVACVLQKQYHGCPALEHCPELSAFHCRLGASGLFE